MPVYAIGDLVPELPEDGDYWIAPDAHVMGRVRIGRGVNIWFGAVLRGDNDLIAVGDGSNVQEGAMLHTDHDMPLTVGRDVTVGHHAILHGCTVGDNSLIGMGATVLNKAVIGRNCLVGANALVTEGKIFADHSLIVGAPAKAARELDASWAESIRKSATGYAAKGRQFARDLRRLD